jgi:hypothetical protein
MSYGGFMLRCIVRRFLFTLFLPIILLSCDKDGENGSETAGLYNVSFYDSNLELRESIQMVVGTYTLEDLQSGYTWYEAETASPVTDYEITGNINFYNIPNVHEIRTQTDLTGVADDLSGYYILINNVYLNGTGWVPIGDTVTPFTGIINGNGFKVTGLYIYSTDEYDNIGLFGILSGTVKNLGVEISKNEVTGAGQYSSVGGIAGRVKGGTIENCYSVGTLRKTGDYNHIGGIAGRIDDSRIENTYFSGNVYSPAPAAAGGIVGDAYNSTIKTCHSTGNINATGMSSIAGGIVGVLSSNGHGGDTIENCYSTAAVTGNFYAGGIAGVIGGKIENSYSSGNVTGLSAGGIAGSVSGGYVKNCYSNGSVTGVASAGGIAGILWAFSITDSYSTGSVTGNSAGGIAGTVNYGSVESSYSTGNVTGVHAGGIAGYIEDDHSSINSCVAANLRITGKNSTTDIGRIVGGIYISLTVTNNFARSDMKVNLTAVGDSDMNGIGKTAATLKKKETYTSLPPEGLGWKFGNDPENPWTIEGSSTGYPVLYWQK